MKLYQNSPRKIGQNLVISNTDMVKNNSMFLAIPPKSTLYEKLGEEMGMYLIKTGNNKMIFRSEDSINCGEHGQNHLDLQLNYSKKNVDFDLGLFRLVCANGLEAFDSMGNVKFNNVLQNKIDPSILINKLQYKIPLIENRIDNIQKIEINEDLKQDLIYNFIEKMKEDSSLYYLKNRDHMKNQDINNMLKLLSNTDLNKVNRIEDSGNNLWTSYNTIQENTVKIVKLFKPTTMLENKLLLDTIKPFYA